MRAKSAIGLRLFRVLGFLVAHNREIIHGRAEVEFFEHCESSRIARQLRDFVANTADVDFAAKQGPVMGGSEYGFLNRAYWDKPWQWKFAWEWGPEAIGAARTAAQAWLKEMGK